VHVKVVLVCDWLHSVWTKSLVCKDDVLTGTPLFRSISEDSACKSEDFRFPVSRPDDRAIPSGRSSVHCSFCPDAHLSTVPSVQTTYHTVQTPDRSSIIRPDDVYFHPDPSLYREAFVSTCIHPDDSAARPDDVQ
jgi:hypothetical protein